MHQSREMDWRRTSGVIVVLLLVIAFAASIGALLFLVLPRPSHARELYAGQFDNIDPATRSWFNGVKAPSGVLCCDIADGHLTDFKVDESGHYFVPLPNDPSTGPNPMWVLVPPEAVITSQGNPNERAVVWYVLQGPGMYHIRCFVPIGGV